MAEFNSRYAGLIFRANGEAKQFHGGRYVTEDADEIAYLEKLSDVERVDAPVEDKPKKPAKGDK